MLQMVIHGHIQKTKKNSETRKKWLNQINQKKKPYKPTSRYRHYIGIYSVILRRYADDQFVVLNLNPVSFRTKDFDTGAYENIPSNSRDTRQGIEKLGFSAYPGVWANLSCAWLQLWHPLGSPSYIRPPCTYEP